jgi:DNA-binding response OmpR family regulator
LNSSFSRILLLDDDEILGELVRRKIKMGIKDVFTGWGVDLVEAQKWEEGRRIAESGEVDVVLLDLAVPPLHTTDMIAMLPAIVPIWPPIVIFTGNKSDEIRQKCLAFGASSFFLKCICTSGSGGGEAVLQSCYNAFLRRRRQGV